MELKPRLRTAYGETVGVDLFISHPDLDGEFTFLSTETSAGVSSLVVENGLKFSDTEYLILGNLGSEKTEIVQVTGTPTATGINLSVATKHPHSKGEKIQFIPYNQVHIKCSLNKSTYTDDYVDIQVSSNETHFNTYLDGGHVGSYRYFYVSFHNEEYSTASQPSTIIDALVGSENSAGQIIRDALISLGEKTDEEVLTNEFLLRALNEGRDEIDTHQNAGRWSFRTVFDRNYDEDGNIYYCIPGRYQITLPTDLRDSDTAKHILSVRIGKDKIPLTWIDKQEMNQWYQGVAHDNVYTTLIGDVELYLNNYSAGDFEDSGTVDIAAEDYDGEIDTVDYTTNDLNSTLGGVTNITANHADGRDVWQGASFGTPTFFTVDNGVMTFNQPFSNDIAGENIWLDYYAKKTVANSFGSVLDENFYSIYVPYMRFRIKLRKNPQMDVLQDFDYRKWIELREAQVNKEFGGQNMRIGVDVPC